MVESNTKLYVKVKVEKVMTSEYFLKDYGIQNESQLMDQMCK